MLAEFCIALVCSLTDCSQDTDRLHQIARDVASIVDASDVLPFDGPASKEATATAMIVVAFHESKFRADVQDCSLCKPKTKWCDNGRSMSIYQIMAWKRSERAALCKSNAYATKVAFDALTKHARLSKSVRGMFCGYASGDPGRCGPAANRLYKLWQTSASKQQIKIDWKKGPTHVEHRAP